MESFVDENARNFQELLIKEESNAVFHFCLNVFRYELRKLTIDGASIDSRKTFKIAEIGS